MKEKEGSAEKYIRVGTTLYKIVQRPLISGDYISRRKFLGLMRHFGRIMVKIICPRLRNTMVSVSYQIISITNRYMGLI
jgi:hypothetical protein